MRVGVGTSGYNYPEWRGHFYPAGLPAKKMFAFYAARFSTVEINYTFYRMPTTTLTEGWRDQAPDGFRYTLKAPRRISHDRRLKDCREAVDQFAKSALALGEHLGALLVQLPPTFRRDVPRLEAFLADVPAGLRVAVEFRHDSWHDDAVREALATAGAALCIADFGDRTSPLWVTARHGYFRLRDAGYTAADLDRWAGEVAARGADWDDVFVYFKHEDEGKGPEFARDFIECLHRRGVAAR